MSEDRLIDERALHAALRLEADERPPLLDLATIRAAAEREAPLSAPVMILGSISVAILSLAGAIVALRVVGFAAALITTGDALALSIAVIAAVGERLELALAVVTQPAVPIAILACLIVAIYHERLQAEGDSHVGAS